jgi:hypothetical protein
VEALPISGKRGEAGRPQRAIREEIKDPGRWADEPGEREIYLQLLQSWVNSVGCEKDLVTVALLSHKSLSLCFSWVDFG